MLLAIIELSSLDFVLLPYKTTVAETQTHGLKDSIVKMSILPKLATNSVKSIKITMHFFTEIEKNNLKIHM